jgi:hypothetical protein
MAQWRERIGLKTKRYTGDVTSVTRWGFLKRSAPDVMVRLAQTFKKLRALFHAEYHIRMGTRLIICLLHHCITYTRNDYLACVLCHI